MNVSQFLFGDGYDVAHVAVDQLVRFYIDGRQKCVHIMGLMGLVIDID